MEADNKKATIAIELTHPDMDIQEIFYEQFVELKNILHSHLNEEWEWALHTRDENERTVSKIYREISPVSIYNQDHWPALISFFKPRIMALDEFWSNAKYAFDALK
jgi:malate synthase